MAIAEQASSTFPLADGTVYSPRKNFCPFATPPLSAYAAILGEERMARLERAAERLRGLKLLEMNATAHGGGVAEMLYSAVPFLNNLGLETEWRVIHGNKEYFTCTKDMHNILQGMPGIFTPEMEQTYLNNLETCAADGTIDYEPDVVTVHDPQPLCLTHYLKKDSEAWLWRCHIDIEEVALKENVSLVDLMTDCIEHYDAAIFSTAHYVVSRWPMPKFIIPPFIDPLADKNRELSAEEVSQVLARYQIDSRVPIVAQIGRFDPWKGLDHTIATYLQVRRERHCQLLLAGGLAADDPEGETILAWICEQTKGYEDIHVLNLPPTSNLEINAFQRAASVIMQPSTKEGFGLVITEALWKGKPVIAGNAGGIPLQIREEETGYFYQTPKRTAQRVIDLLDSPAEAQAIGSRGRQYVAEHFLMPDRLADYLKTIDITVNATRQQKIPADAIISFHPWYKLAKRKRGQTGGSLQG